MALNAPYTPNTVIQSTQVSNDLTGLANGSNDTATNSMSTFRSEELFDNVASGCVWSGDSYASTRNGSMTAGVIYLGGVRLVIASVSGHLFTASKDTYIDVNSSGTIIYTEATNNAASPALTAGNIRIGIIITGATNIAAATSVNQGQEQMVLPIAANVAYSVQDSLGNLICPRDPDRTTLGYRQSLASVTNANNTDSQVTGLSCPVIIPGNRKIEIEFYVPQVSSTVDGSISVATVYDGTIGGGGTQIQQANSSAPANGGYDSMSAKVELTPTASSKTYNAGIRGASNTTTFAGGANFPQWIKVKLA